MLAACEALDWSFDNVRFLEVPRDSVPFFLEVICLGNGFFWFCGPLAAFYHALFSVAVLTTVALAIWRLKGWRTTQNFERAEVCLMPVLAVVNVVLWLEYTIASTAKLGSLWGVFYVEDSTTIVASSVNAVFVFASTGLWLRKTQRQLNRTIEERWLRRSGDQ